jgi:hypothetical protein
MATPSTGKSTDTTGASADVKSNLKSETRAVTSVTQALSICDQLIEDADKLIKNAAKITSKINGERPRSSRADANKAKLHKSNISTGALATTCSKIPPRFYMPLKTARYLVAGCLPPEVDNSAQKTEFFRTAVTTAIRKWRKWNFFLQGLANEVGVYGYAFPSFFNQYEWRPKLIRQDKGFVPVGTELLDTDIPFYVVKWSYRPDELLALVKKAKEKKKKSWNEDAVVKAINKAMPPDKHGQRSDTRSYEDLIRQATTGASYSKGAKMIETYHLFAKEITGKISHYILLGDGATNTNTGSDDDSRLLYEKLDRFDSMDEVTNPMVFQFGNGTIHGSLGAGHILYDMSVQVELTRNESFDNLKLSNKIKLEVPDGKDVNAVKAMVFDEKVIVSGAKYAGSSAAMTVSVDGFMALDQKMTQLMEEKVGAFLPPAIIPGTSPTATQVNVQTAREDEIRQFMLDNWLTQFAVLAAMIAKRLCDPASPDEEAQALQEKLKKKLDKDEIEQLVESCSMQNILEFTDAVGQRRAQFAASVRNNPYYDQEQVERTISQAAVGPELSALLMPQGQDQAMVAEAARQQVLENAVLAQGQQGIPVIPKDNDYIHLEALKQPLTEWLSQGNIAAATNGLAHYQAHYNQWIAKKVGPKDKKNDEKKLIASFERALQSLQKRVQQQQQLSLMQGGQSAPLPGAPGLPNVAPVPAAPPQMAQAV